MRRHLFILTRRFFLGHGKNAVRDKASPNYSWPPAQWQPPVLVTLLRKILSRKYRTFLRRVRQGPENRTLPT